MLAAAPVFSRGFSCALRPALSAVIICPVTARGFPERLREVREARGLKVTELNRKAGLSLGSVTRMELGGRKTVGAAIVKQLADVLQVTMDWLWAGVGSGDADPLAASFLMAVDRRKLREVIEREPGRWKLSTIAQAVQLDLPSDPDGVPLGGWAKALEALEAGNAPRVRKPARRR